MGQAHEVGWGEFDFKAATACGAVDSLEVLRQGVDDDREPAAVPERGDAAEHVAGGALGGGGGGHPGLLATDRGRERLEIELPGYRHDADGQRAVDVRDQRLEYPRRVQPERFDGFEQYKQAFGSRPINELEANQAGGDR